MSSIAPGPLREAGAPPASAFRAVVVEREEQLSEFEGAWEDLAASCIEPNVFYEPWMLRPALRHIGAPVGTRFVFLFAPRIADPEREILCGFFPLQRCKTETVVPVPALGLLRHPYCYLRTPLLRARYARECMTAFFDWYLGLPETGSVLELGDIPGSGSFRQLLTDELFRRGSLTFPISSYNRALFRLGRSAESYLSHALSSRHRREFGRKARRLADHGALTYESIRQCADIDAWIEDFLRLEACGWKGRGGTALLSRPETAAFFREIMREAAARRRLHMVRLLVGGKPCAARVSFTAGTGAMAFKLGYDETFSRYSPGMLLELENVRLAHEQRDLDWLDSGADPNSRLFNQLWVHRRTIETLLIAGRSRRGAVLVSLLPLARLANRLLLSSGLRRAPQEEPHADDP